MISIVHTQPHSSASSDQKQSGLIHSLWEDALARALPDPVLGIMLFLTYCHELMFSCCLMF